MSQLLHAETVSHLLHAETGLSSGRVGSIGSCATSSYSTLILRYCIICLFFQFCKQTQRWRQNGPWNLLPLWEVIMALAFCITVGSGVTVGSRLTGRWQGDFSFFRTVSFLMQLRTGALSHTVTIIWPIVVHHHKTNSSCFKEANVLAR